MCCGCILATYLLFHVEYTRPNRATNIGDKIKQSATGVGCRLERCATRAGLIYAKAPLAQVIQMKVTPCSLSCDCYIHYPTTIGLLEYYHLWHGRRGTSFWCTFVSMRDMCSSSVLVGFIFSVVSSIMTILPAIVSLAVGLISPFLTSPPLILGVMICMAGLLMCTLILYMRGSSTLTSFAMTSFHGCLRAEGVCQRLIFLNELGLMWQKGDG